MEHISLKVDNWESKGVIKYEKPFRGGILTLVLDTKKICSNCGRDHKVSSCGYSSYTKNELDIQGNIKFDDELKTDLEKALFNENLSDFTFIVENEKIPVSKILLAARSPVFERMFNSEFKEKNESQQTITTPTLKVVFKELIRYIYTGEVCNLSEHVYNLTYAADYYQVPGLKNICEEEMHKVLSENNAHKIFQTAHLYQCKRDLINAAFTIIKKIFQKWNLTIPEECVNNPLKVSNLFDKKEALEKELLIDDVPKLFENKEAKVINLESTDGKNKHVKVVDD